MTINDPPNFSINSDSDYVSDSSESYYCSSDYYTEDDSDQEYRNQDYSIYNDDD